MAMTVCNGNFLVSGAGPTVGKKGLNLRRIGRGNHQQAKRGLLAGIDGMRDIDGAFRPMHFPAPLIVDKDQGVRADAIKVHQDGTAGPILRHMNRPFVPHPGETITVESRPRLTHSSRDDSGDPILTLLPTPGNSHKAPVAAGLLPRSVNRRHNSPHAVEADGCALAGFYFNRLIAPVGHVVGRLTGNRAIHRETEGISSDTEYGRYGACCSRNLQEIPT